MAVAYLDIETTSRAASDGMIIAIGISTEQEPEVRFADSLLEERRSLEWLNEKLEGCDKLVTWYGNGFDIPFIVSRAILHKVDIPRLTELIMIDLYDWCRANLLLSSYSLESVARFLGVSVGRGFKEFRGPDILALFKLVERGDHEARKLIVEHCKEDIITLKLVHERLKPQVERSDWGLHRRTPREE